MTGCPGAVDSIAWKDLGHGYIYHEPAGIPSIGKENGKKGIPGCVFGYTSNNEFILVLEKDIQLTAVSWSNNCPAILDQLTKECIALHDSATNLLNKYYFEGSDPAKLDLILDLLNLAINCDSNFFLAYNNKVTVLSTKGEYQKVVKLLDEMLVFSDNNPQLIFLKGIAYEKLNDNATAEAVYKQAAVGYEKQLKLYPDSLQLITDKLFFTAFTKGKDEALSELNNYILKYPDKSILKDFQPMFENFSRDDFMNQYRK